MSDFDPFKPLCRTSTVDLGGGHEVLIREFTTTHAKALQEQLSDKDLEKDDAWYAAVALRFLRGAEHQPSDDDVSRFQSAQSPATIGAIVKGGLQLSNGEIATADAAKKSSASRS